MLDSKGKLEEMKLEALEGNSTHYKSSKCNQNQSKPQAITYASTIMHSLLIILSFTGINENTHMFKLLFDPEHEGPIILLYVSNYLPINTAITKQEDFNIL